MLHDHLETSQMTLDEVSHETDIPLNYIEAINDRQGERLPPLPYMRAHLIKLAALMQLDPGLVADATHIQINFSCQGY